MVESQRSMVDRHGEFTLHKGNISIKEENSVLIFVKILLVARCSLVFSRCALLLARCMLLFTRCSLLSARSSLFFAPCLLLLACYLLLSTRYSLLFAYCPLRFSRYSLLFTRCSLLFTRCPRKDLEGYFLNKSKQNSVTVSVKQKLETNMLDKLFWKIASLKTSCFENLVKYRSSCSQMFFIIAVLENFALFTGKNPFRWSLFTIKLQPWIPEDCSFFKKETLAQVFSCEFYEIFSILWMTASGCRLENHVETEPQGFTAFNLSCLH